MNAQNIKQFEGAAAKVTPRWIRQPATKVRSRAEIVATLAATLVSGFGVPFRFSMMAADRCVDNYCRHFHSDPANAEYVVGGLRLPQGRTMLDGIVAELKRDQSMLDKVPTIAAKPVARPVVAEKTLPEAVQGHLTDLLREARKAHLASGRSPKERNDELLDVAIDKIVTTCKAEGLNWFQMPYVNMYPAAGVLIGRLMQGQKDNRLPKFFFRWTALADGGVPDEVLPKPVVRKTLASAAVVIAPTPVNLAKDPAVAAQQRKAVEARRSASRAARLQAQPRKGKTGEQGGKNQPKGKKKGK